MVGQLVLKLAGLNKLVVSASSGKMVLLFLNVSLACDYRIVADNTVYQNANMDIGLAPKGGGVFFLSRLLGTRETSKLLLAGGDISAAKALQLGIVDEVVPLEELPKAAMAAAKNLAGKPSSYAVGIKKLLNYDMDDLQRYLEYEKEELRKAIRWVK
jgi:enoyl-CoA hydratase/carnithine racemase